MSELHEYFPALLRGARITLLLAVLSVLLSVCLGLAGALAKQSGSRMLVSTATAYTTLIRGVPEFVMMLLVFYGGQILINHLAAALGFHAPDVNAFVTAVLTIGFIFGAYYTETFRAKIDAVTPAQVKSGAATLLGSDNSVIAIVGDYAKVKDQLAGYTNITFLDLNGKTIPPPQ